MIWLHSSSHLDPRRSSLPLVDLAVNTVDLFSAKLGQHDIRGAWI